MAKKIRKHIVKKVLLKKPVPKEELATWNGNIPLNIAKYDRISFSVLINKRREVQDLGTPIVELTPKQKLTWPKNLPFPIMAGLSKQ